MKEQASTKKDLKEMSNMILSFVLSHICFLILFYIAGIKEMFMYNIVSVTYFSVLYYLSANAKIEPTRLDLLASTELFIHQILAIYFVGLEPGFQFIFWGLVSPLISYNAKKTFKAFAIIRGTLACVCFAASNLIFYLGWKSVYTITNQKIIIFLKIFIMFITFFIVGISSLHTFEKFKEKIRKEYMLYQNEVNKKLETQEDIIKMIANIIEARDEDTGKHTERTSVYVNGILQKLKTKPGYDKYLTDEYIKHIVSAATLHDIGKIKIPDTVLNKPGKLSNEEYELIKTHTIEGAKLIDMCNDSIEDKEYLKIAKEIVLSHHERIDGKGYPYGLKDDEIPFPARVMAIADVYDALTSKRVYKEKFDRNLAINILKDGRDKQFDSELLDAFLEYLKENPSM